MRRKLTYSLIGLVVFLFFWINLPQTLSDSFRSRGALLFKMRSMPSHSEEKARLQLENQMLRSQMDHLYEWVLYEQKIREEVQFSKLKTSYVKESLAHQLFSLPAQVTHRDPTSWSSSLWINIGEETNRAVGKKVVAKNSPVLADGFLVGVVEYVGEKQARVRLITDSGLCPAVQVYRGGIQNREISRQIEALVRGIEKREDLFSSSEKKEQFLKELQELKKACRANGEDGYFAKGEVHGSSAPFWRSRSSLLQGIGFHFSVESDMGEYKACPNLSILKEGDLLVTSGLDGVFPAGLFVGYVWKVEPLKPGGYSYEIKVRPCVNHFHDLQALFVIPPLEGV